MSTVGLSFRDGTARDLSATFALAERTRHDAAMRQGIASDGPEPTPVEVRGDWHRERALIEFMAAQPDGRYVICEAAEEPIGYARVVRFGGMEQLTELRVDPEHQGRGVAGRCSSAAGPGIHRRSSAGSWWPRERPADLSLYTEFGVMPITGHWHMRAADRRISRDARGGARGLRAGRCARPRRRERRGRVEAPRAERHRAPPAAAARVLRARPHLPGARGRRDRRGHRALLGELRRRDRARRWGRGPRTSCRSSWRRSTGSRRRRSPSTLDVYSTTISWWLLRRLRGLGFHVHWPGWVLCSIPLPGLDRYVPTRPLVPALTEPAAPARDLPPATCDPLTMGKAPTNFARRLWRSWSWPLRRTCCSS